MSQPLSNLNQVYRLILQEEKQRDFSNSKNTTIISDSTAFASYQRNQFIAPRPNPQSFTHVQNPGQNIIFGIAPNGKKSKYYYTHCKIWGHSIECCFKIHGYPNGPRPDFKGKKVAGNVQTYYPNQDADCNGMEQLSLHNEECGPDVGGMAASSPNGGSIACPALSQEQYNQLLALLCQHKGQFVSCGVTNPPSAFLQGPTQQRHLVLGNQQDGLYLVNKDFHVASEFSQTGSVFTSTLPSYTSASDSIACTVTSAHVWHCRLGHLPFDRFKYINGIDCSVSCPDIWHYMSSAWVPFPSSSIKSIHPFDSIHVDIWGPYSIPTHSGSRYYLTIVDDFSRATWVHLFSHKSNAFPLLQGFISYVQTQSQAIVKTVRSDNGVEFSETTAETFY